MKYIRIFLLILTVFILRLLLSFLPSFTIDMDTWLFWAQRLAEAGPGRFYSDDVWTQYTPGFLYWLWFGGEIGWVNEFLVKLPAILADIVTGSLIWYLLSKKRRKIAIGFLIFYVLNPAVVFNGSVWGQIDGIFTMFLFLSLFHLVERKNIVLSSIFWGVALLIKPQAIALLPPLVFIALKTLAFRKILVGSLISLVIIVVGSLPFFPNNPVLGLPEFISKMSNYYSYTSVFAFNLWSFVGMWKPDNQLFARIPLFWWGAFTYLLALVLIYYRFKDRLDKEGVVYLVAALSLFAFFLFPTRVHERYLFPTFAFLLVAGGLLRSRLLLGVYWFLSLLHLINLYHPYAYYTENFLKSQTILDLTSSSVPFVALGMLACFFGILFHDRISRLKVFPRLPIKSGTHQLGFLEIPIIENSANKIIIGILLFALFSRLIFLNFPTTFYFDEVYHAFTAREVLRGNVAAWEWWTTPPEGFAYEWTHPPLAKLGMVLGMWLFGEQPFGWRLPGALLGSATVFLVYLLGLQLFKNKTIGLFAAGIFVLDGLPLVMARIGMNDTYFLFFALFTIFLFLKEKYLISSVFFGLAAASKWTAAWVLPVIFVAMLLFRIKPRFNIFWFGVVPPLVYLISYIPFFLTGHTISQFVSLQQQMWWYHTGLEASHAFQSSWWSWPLMLRPVWLFSQVKDSLVSNIYAIGNPFVFWIGIVAVIFCFIRGVLQRQRTLLFVVLAWGLLFLPWALSPRVMFLYHYLPAIPFLSLALGWLLSQQKQKIVVLTYYMLLFACYLFFFPHWTGIFVPSWVDSLYYWLPSWR